MRKPFYPLLFVASITLTSCSSIMNNIPGVYTIDIQQGNIVNQDMIDQLRPKMTKRQVLYIMGSSMLVDVFHQKRWDYLYSNQPSGEARRQKRLSLFFDGDELIGVQGDFRPSSLPVITQSHDTTVEVPKRDLDNTLWGKMKRLWSDDAPTTLEDLENESVNHTAKSSTDKSNKVLDENELIGNKKNQADSDLETSDTELPEAAIDNDTADSKSISTEVENGETKATPSSESEEVLDKAKLLATENADTTTNVKPVENPNISIKPLDEEKTQILEPLKNEFDEVLDKKTTDVDLKDEIKQQLEDSDISIESLEQKIPQVLEEIQH